MAEHRGAGSRAIRRLSRRPLILLGAVVAVLAVIAGVVAASIGGGLPTPSQDPFYRYHGTTPLAAVAPGSALAARAVTLKATGTGRIGVPARQILYRTTTATGQPTVSVTTVVVPARPPASPRIVADMSAYDALTSRCDPSYTLRGGRPGAANQAAVQQQLAVIAELRNAGYIVTVPDFEDENLDFLTGTESGMSALDAIRATLATLRLGRSAPVGLMGYSGGSVAAEWASELAPRYAPGVHLVGVAEGGLPVDLAHNVGYVNGSASWSDVIPAALIGISRGFHIDLRRYLTGFGRRIVAADSHQCLGQFLGAHPHLTVAQLFNPGDTKVAASVFGRAFNRLIMGSAPGHPAEPLLMVAGNSDGTGDGVMVAKDEAALASRYCRQGVPVDFEQLQGLDHAQAGRVFITEAFSYLGGRFAGDPAPSDCATVPPGNSLAPTG